MNAFTYNGTSSYNLGLRIESKNVFSTPQYDTTLQSIPGRDGDLIIPNGRFPNVQVTYSVFLPAKTLAELAQKLTAVKAWLYTEPGVTQGPSNISGMRAISSYTAGPLALKPCR